MSERVYTYRSWMPIAVGMLFVVAGAFFQVSVISDYLSGHPTPIYVNDKLVQNPAPWVNVLLLFFPAIFWSVGTLLVMYVWRARVVLDDLGVVGYGLGRRPKFVARWQEIHSVEIGPYQKGTRLRIVAAGRKLDVTSGLRGWDAFVADVTSCSPVPPTRS